MFCDPHAKAILPGDFGGDPQLQMDGMDADEEYQGGTNWRLGGDYVGTVHFSLGA